MRTQNRKNSSPKHAVQAKSPETKCQDRLCKKIFDLYEKEVLKNSLQPGTNEFEVLEFYGDAHLYERVSFFLLTTRRFMSPHLLSVVRVSCIRNSNLANVHDLLRLGSLCPSPAALAPKTLVKWKGDIVEAVIGELREAENTDSDASMLLNELLAFIAYCGEKDYFESAAQTFHPESFKKDLPEVVEIVSEPVADRKSSSDGSPTKRVSFSSVHAPPAPRTAEALQNKSPVSILKHSTPSTPSTAPVPSTSNPKRPSSTPSPSFTFAEPQARTPKPTHSTVFPQSPNAQQKFNPVLILDNKGPSSTPKTVVFKNPVEQLFAPERKYAPLPSPFLTPSEVRRQMQPVASYENTGLYNNHNPPLFNSSPFLQPQIALST